MRCGPLLLPMLWTSEDSTHSVDSTKTDDSPPARLGQVRRRERIRRRTSANLSKLNDVSNCRAPENSK
jgi:hypothetical protein